MAKPSNGKESEVVGLHEYRPARARKPDISIQQVKCQAVGKRAYMCIHPPGVGAVLPYLNNIVLFASSETVIYRHNYYILFHVYIEGYC